jgi:hypothetical protein
MTLVTHDEEPIEALLSELQHRVDSVVSQAATHSHAMDKHETHLTSRLAHAIHAAIVAHPIEVDGLKLEVYVEEFNPMQESKSGADLYISIVRSDTGIPTSKGMLVQSKRREALKRPDERRRLRNQSARMRRRSPDGSYVWIFEEYGVTCIPAPKSSDPVIRGSTYERQSVGSLIANGLRCRQGDKNIGRNVNTKVPEGLKSALRRLSTPNGIGFEILPDGSTSHMSRMDD